MEVTSKNDFVTHAVIGRHAPIEFGISDNPEFFQVLSKALYSDQELAVVREVICNAWDAHIEGSITNEPIEIFVRNQELVIRDFGAGIAHEDIGRIYGVYGASEKAKDGTVTGGFGLGCKAPFAYTDIFEVTSCCQGVKTVYSMSRSSAQANGRPSITPIVSLPTDESGLTVRIKLLNWEHESTFTLLSRMIVSNGGIYAKLNNEPTSILNLPMVPGSYVFTTKTLYRRHHGHQQQHVLNVRYGNVIYPITQHSNYEQAFDKITRLLSAMMIYGHSSGRTSLVIQAESHSLSVTPSRESLSMQDKTVGSLKKLLEDFLPIIVEELPKNIHKIIGDNNQSLVNQGKFHRLLNPGPVMNLASMPQLEITAPGMLAMEVLRHQYSSNAEYSSWDIRDRLDRISKSNFHDRGLIREFLKEIKRHENNITSTWDWYNRYVLRKLYRDLQMCPEAHIDRLFMLGKMSSKKMINPRVVDFNMGFDTILRAMRKIVILSYKQPDVFLYGDLFPEVKDLGGISRAFVYIVQRKARHVEAMREFFKKRNFVLLDLTLDHPWMPIPAKPLVTIKKPPKQAGHVRLNAFWSVASSSAIYPGKSLNKDLPRITNPEFSAMFKPKLKGDENLPILLGLHSAEGTKKILQHIGHLGAFCVSKVQVENLEKQDVPRIDMYILKKTLEEMRINPRIKDFLGLRAVQKFKEQNDQYSSYHDVAAMMNTVLGSKEGRALFDMENSLTALDRFWMSMWDKEVLYLWHPWKMLGEAKEDCSVAKLQKEIEKTPLHPRALKFLDMFSRNKTLLSLINSDALKNLVRNPDMSKDALDIVAQILKG